jgi:hypothetical protein
MSYLYKRSCHNYLFVVVIVTCLLSEAQNEIERHNGYYFFEKENEWHTNAPLLYSNPTTIRLLETELSLSSRGRMTLGVGEIFWLGTKLSLSSRGRMTLGVGEIF